MAKDYQCPRCKNPVDRAATVCSNVECRAALAFCSHCRDVTTYEQVEAGKGALSRDKFRCDRCQGMGVKCLTWVTGGYCNGLARASGRFDKPLCSSCNDRMGEVSRSVLGWSLISVLGGIIKPRR